MQRYEVSLQLDLKIPMRDGVNLAGDLYLPAQGGRPIPGPLPVILERTPYDKRRPGSTATAAFFARRGYAVLMQDVRGRSGSEGAIDPFGPGEALDGHDTLLWLGAQPWCNGKVGTIGLSYGACVQAALGMTNPPNLGAQFIAQGFANHHTGRHRMGGAARLTMMAWAFRMAQYDNGSLSNPAVFRALSDAEQNVRRWMDRMPLRQGQTPLAALPEYERYALSVQNEGDWGEYWQAIGRDADAYWDEYADVPVYLLGSWYDSHSHVTVDAFRNLRARKQSPVKLIMGPWNHGALDQPYAGEAYFGPLAALEYNDLRLRWFDQTLRGAETGLLDEAPVRIFVMGGGSGRRLVSVLETEPRIDHGGTWRDEHEWPLARTRYTQYYLHAGGSLSPRQPEGESPPSSYRFDPHDPVPTVGGCVSSTFQIGMAPGGFDQRARPELGHKDNHPLAGRPDVLVFESEPLEQGMEVTGPLEVTLFVSSSAPDTDFTAKLVDVYPPSPDYPLGFALNLTDSIQRARYRESYANPTLLEQGQVYTLTIKLPPTSNYFAAGHRIRLDISSSNYPRFDVNPNTGEPVGRNRRTEVAVNSVWHDARRPSHVLLPMIPR